MLKVVVADDSADVRKGLKNVIQWEKLGAELVLVAQNGQDVIDFIQEYEVDLIISDIKMPKVNGIELSRYINTFYSGTVIIILSAYADFAYAQEAMSYGASEYILKPIDRKKLGKISQIIKELVQRREQNTKLNILLHNTEFKQKVISILEKADLVDFEEICNLKEEYQNAELLVIKEYYRFILENILRFSIEINFTDFNEMEIHNEFMRINTPKELKRFVVGNYKKILGHLSNSEYQKTNLVDKIIEFINKNYLNKDLNSGSIAEHFKLSATYVGVVFKKVKKLTLSEYIYFKRMEKAKDLIKKTMLPIATISDMVGYEDRDYFTKLFKKYTGQAPTDYRQNDFDEGEC